MLHVFLENLAQKVSLIFITINLYHFSVPVFSLCYCYRYFCFKYKYFKGKNQFYWPKKDHYFEYWYRISRSTTWHARIFIFHPLPLPKFVVLKSCGSQNSQLPFFAFAIEPHRMVSKRAFQLDSLKWFYSNSWTNLRHSKYVVGNHVKIWNSFSRFSQKWVFNKWPSSFKCSTGYLVF